MKKTCLVLASASPRRRQILKDAGIPFRVAVSGADETVSGDVSPEEKVRLLSERKARAVVPSLAEGEVVLAADTVVALDNTIHEKPGNPEKAAEMLRLLSGRSHRVLTGITLSDGKKTVSDVVITTVSMRPLDEDEILRYVATGSPLDKAGAYGIQEHAGLFVSSFEGDYFNIVGLPLYRTGEILKHEFNFKF